ncbi:rpoA, DNA-directed RNA polymerase subunit alpha [Nostoc sphaeroides CCNUC1]|uniref:RpoA, DNA-directed RNA polymerase subunit alpha n=1 Tax=Nostoc sphaeroides CCNUC1 TaxID=2653204 RepID=A0A5P8W3H5_9NOSO|nr:rpoA, DNA-directed RNA polymerase subunit alpha [Nostoc sphaeroides CCNUC1]
MKPNHIKSELSNLVKDDWLTSVDAGVEATVSVNTVYEQLAKIDRVLEILEDNKTVRVVDANVDSVDKINFSQRVDSISPDNQLGEVANSNVVHPVEEINEDNKSVSVIDENSIESLNLKKNTYTALKDAQINTIEDLNKYGVTGLRSLKNLGHKSVSQIVEALQSRGIELPELPDPEHTPSL